MYNPRVRTDIPDTPVGGGFRGARARLLAFDEVNAGNPVQGGVTYVEKPTQLDSDVHHTFEMGVLLSGQEQRYFGSIIRTVSPGDAWWAVAWEPHGWRTTRAPSGELVIHFVPEFLGDVEVGGVSWLSFFAAAPEQRPGVTGKETRREVLALGRALAREFEQEDWGWQSIVRCHMLNLLATIGRESVHLDSKWLSATTSTSGLARVMPAVELLHEDLSWRLPLEEAAATCGLSPAWFRKLFKETIGVTYSQFERRARLALAARLLLGTDMPIEAISERTGFVDASHFHRTFSKQYACTPTEFRTRGRHVNAEGSD